MMTVSIFYHPRAFTDKKEQQNEKEAFQDGSFPLKIRQCFPRTDALRNIVVWLCFPSLNFEVTAIYSDEWGEILIKQISK